MNFIKSITDKRNIKKAFDAIEQGDLKKLIALNVSPNAERLAVVNGSVSIWKESLLSRAFREKKYNIAEYLLNSGANPYFYDDAVGDLNMKLTEFVKRLVIDNGVLKSKNDMFMGYPNPNEQPAILTMGYEDDPALSCLVALRLSLQRLKHLQPRSIHFSQLAFNPEQRYEVSDATLNAWVDDQMAYYEVGLTKTPLKQTAEEIFFKTPSQKI